MSSVALASDSSARRSKGKAVLRFWRFGVVRIFGRARQDLGEWLSKTIQSIFPEIFSFLLLFFLLSVGLVVG